VIADKAPVKDPLSDDRYDRQQWKTMQQTMSDANKYVDLLHSVPWQDGLPTELIAGLGKKTCSCLVHSNRYSEGFYVL